MGTQQTERCVQDFIVQVKVYNVAIHKKIKISKHKQCVNITNISINKQIIKNVRKITIGHSGDYRTGFIDFSAISIIFKIVIIYWQAILDIGFIDLMLDNKRLQDFTN